MAKAKNVAPAAETVAVQNDAPAAETVAVQNDAPAAETVAVQDGAPDSAPADQSGEVDVLSVVSVGVSFNRAGFTFTRTPRELKLADLSDEAIAALKAEPQLIVSAIKLKY